MIIYTNHSDGDYVRFDAVSRMLKPPLYRQLAVYSEYELGLAISEVKVLGIRE